MLAFTELSADKQDLKESAPQEEEVKYDANGQAAFFRFGAEEVLRRAQKRDADKLTSTETFQLLLGDNEMLKLRDTLKHRRIEEEREKNKPKEGEGGPYAKY